MTQEFDVCITRHRTEPNVLPSFPPEGIVMQMNRKSGGEPLILRITPSSETEPHDLNTVMGGVPNLLQRPVTDAVTGRHLGNVSFSTGTSTGEASRKVAWLSAIEIEPATLSIVDESSIRGAFRAALEQFASMNNAEPVEPVTAAATFRTNRDAVAAALPAKKG